MIRYPFHIYQDEECPEYWIGAIPGVGGSPTSCFMTQGKTPEEVRASGPSLLDGYILVRMKHSLPLEEAQPLPKAKGWEWLYPTSQVLVAMQIREAREKADLTQAEAVKLMGVSQAAYGRWEQLGKCNATLGTLERIARVLGRKLEVTLK